MPGTAAAQAAPTRRPRRIARVAALLAPWILVLAVLAAGQLGRLAPLDSQRPREPSAQKSPLAPLDSQRPREPSAQKHTAGTTAPTTGRDEASLTSDAHTAQVTIPTDAPVVTGAPPDTVDEGQTTPAPAVVPAVAVRLVRDAVTGRHADTTAAIDVAVPEAPQSLGADQWLVRVHAVVLRGDTRRWRSATHEVWAVPIGMSDEQAVGLDAPWPVATERPRVTEARWASEAVDETAVRSALRAAGLRPAGKFAAERHPRIPHVIRVRVAGGRNRYVWLRTTPTMHVLGTQGPEAVE